VPVGGWESAPGCIQHDVPGSEGVYKAYENCKDFFTFGRGSTDLTLASDVNSSYWILVTIGIIVMIAALVGWVVLEDRKLQRQASYLLTQGIGAKARAAVPQPGVGGPAEID
jgi:hypothetical protein